MGERARSHVSVLSQCQCTREFLASLYEIALSAAPTILQAKNGTLPFAHVLKTQRTFWERALPCRRLLDLDPRELANRIRTQYAEGDDDLVELGLYALLEALDGCAGQEDPDALLKALHGPSKVRPEVRAREYFILPRPANLIFSQVKCLPDSELFRDDRGTAPQVGDFLESLVFAEVPASRQFRVAMPNIKLRKTLSDIGCSLRIGVFPLSRSLEFEFASAPAEPGRIHYSFVDIRNEDAVWGEIEGILRACRDGPLGLGPVHIVVFPELTITASLEARIARWLRTENDSDRIALVIAGSFHRADMGQRDVPANVSPVLQFDGSHVEGIDSGNAAAKWLQPKLNPFRITVQNLDAMRACEDTLHFRDFLRLFAGGAEEGVEHIAPGSTWLLFDLPIGRAAVAICLDYLADTDIRLLADLGVSIVFVPAMSPTTERFRETDRRLGRAHHSAVFCANSAWIVAPGHEEKGSSHIYLPMKKGICRLHPGPSGEHQCRFASVALGGLILDVGKIAPDAPD